MKIFLAGGGTGGPITPLIAVAEAIAKIKPDTKFFLIGTNQGLEQKFLGEFPQPITYLTIPAGKLRRYFSLKNVIDVFKIFLGFIKSIRLIRKYEPNMIFGAGSYVQVPLIWAGYLFGVPAVIHQQDLDLTLSTKLTFRMAKAVSVGFAHTAKNIHESSGMFANLRKSKIEITGNPVRANILRGSKNQAIKFFGLNTNFPTVLVIGGGTGAASLNTVIIRSLQQLTKYVQIIHLTGGRSNDKIPTYRHYHSCDFLDDKLKHAYAVADLVIARGGMGTITEIAALGKPAILVPLPDSPQMNNVSFLALFKGVVGVAEEVLDPELLVKLVRKILWSKEIQETMRNNLLKFMPKDSAQKIAKIVIQHAKS